MTTAAATSTPPLSVRGASGWASTTLASSAPQNGSTVLTIAVRTGPIAARPRRKAMNAISVHTTASSAIMSQTMAGSRAVTSPVAAAAMARITAAPAVANAAVRAGESSRPRWSIIGM